MSSADPIADARRHLIGHGALLIFAGGAIGFGFLFFLIGHITLWPIPGVIEVQLPGTYDAWRMAHLEGIINGFALWLAAAVLPLIPLSTLGRKRTAHGLIVVAWTFVIASLLDPLFPHSRGLEFGGPATNQIAFFLFYVGVVLVMLITATIAWKALRRPQIDPT
ncbi:hypothetical protein E4T66_00660 [Sinimarinibacterium sp. CAU 1509]|uniref:hypothetical protein n=1 Tax=Sinimarinibacterium sp. CAU 1509 TaxID=2562283 RepID=UPI0010AC5ED5|nr:hypothetical protein [Sinimarinibacterium sp. CAU 1509]TJY64790.1 hypothetical protein E4T66_00660 [Sinimarinibacterium sp. CAU 1509]